MQIIPKKAQIYSAHATETLYDIYIAGWKIQFHVWLYLKLLIHGYMPWVVNQWYCAFTVVINHHSHSLSSMGFLPDTQNCGAHAPRMPGTFSPSPQVSDPDMHHGTCVTHVPWCMPGSLTSGFLWNRQRGKTFRHSRHMRNLPFYVSGKRPVVEFIWKQFTFTAMLVTKNKTSKIYHFSMFISMAFRVRGGLH